jgi:hypothetical protein
MKVRLGDLLVDLKSMKRFSVVIGQGVNENSFWIYYFTGILQGNVLLLPEDFIIENFKIEQSICENI